MPELNWHIILTGLLYAVLTGVFNLIFSRKTQIEEWCAANPRLAALGMFMRSVGFDPHNLWAFATLFITKKLPAIKIADSAVVREEVRKLEAKANKKDPPDDPDTTVSLMPDPVRMVAQDRSRLHNDKPEPDDEPAECRGKWVHPDWRLQLVFGVLLACVLGCGGTTPAPKAPCDPLTLGQITTFCSAEAYACGKAGKTESECTAECDAKLDARAEECRK